MMRQAKELETNNCTNLSVNYDEECESLNPGDDRVYGIEFATATLEQARQSEQFLLFEKNNSTFKYIKYKY
jgi:hypothetical protein